MGIIKQTHQAEKEKRKMLGDRAENFKNEVIEIGRKEKMRAIPAMDKYGLILEIQYFGHSLFGRFKKEKFRKRISALGRSYGMVIVPTFDKYGLGTEIQICQDKNPNENKNKN